MILPAKLLTFSVVDELAFAADEGLEVAALPDRYSPAGLGPLLELIYLMINRALPFQLIADKLEPNGASPMILALQENREQWISSDKRRAGFISAIRNGPDGDSRLTSFLMNAQRAAQDVAGLSKATSGQLVAAMEELENNIHEHSESTDTGILAFRAVNNVFEFLAADRGIGVLSSLRKCSAYATLVDYGKALESALTDGTSRFGIGSKRGHGFRPIFLGLVNLRGYLRFRSGDHALLMDGKNPNLSISQLAQKPNFKGFLASVSCQKL